MSKRIQELAKEWGRPSRDLVACLETLGLPGKRAQSSLEDADIDRLATALGRDDRPAVTVGEQRIVERVVAGEAVDTVGATIETTVESRVKRNVIRRRVRREVVGSQASEGTSPDDFFTGAESWAAPEAGAVDPLIGFEAPPADTRDEGTLLPEPPVVEAPAQVAPLVADSVAPPPGDEGGSVPDVATPTLPAAPLPAAEAPVAAAVVEAEPDSAPASVSETAPPNEVPSGPRLPGGRIATGTRPRTVHVVRSTPHLDPSAPKLDNGMRRVQVLGKIELRRPEPAAPRRPAPGAAPAGPAGAPGGAGAPAPGAADARPKKGKKVIRRQGPFDPFAGGDRGRAARRPQKRRVAPGKEVRQTEITTPSARKRIVRIGESISVGELARSMGLKAGELIKKLMEMGVMATVNHTLDLDHATLIAGEFEYTVESTAVDVEKDLAETEAEEVVGEVLPRDPVVTMMGHVDHGKTSLLDMIRRTTVAAGEAGGITQHIGAYAVNVGARRICFLDTPGHEAFTAMRARGAQVTDIVVLVVAADDGVMPQTVEAINHARAASVPIIVAANKIDRPDADLERLKKQLADHGLVAEDWGGDTTICPVSAKTGAGLDQMMELILLQADVLELRARTEGRARGRVVEAKLDRGRGPVATILVQEGCLNEGDAFVVGNWSGRVRAMLGSRGEALKSAGPSTPVEILGLGGVPDAGDAFAVAPDEATARDIAAHRQSKQRDREIGKSTKVSLEDFHRQLDRSKIKELRIVLKVDVQGSGEALREAFARLSNDEVQVSVLHCSVGGVTESDILLASASNAVVVGFNVRPEAKAAVLAESEGVDIRLYTIVYDAIAEIRQALEGLLEPTYRERTVGRAEVRQVFGISGAGVIAGSTVLDGKVLRSSPARLLRDHAVIHQGRIGSLRRFKDDVREVTSGYECGIGLEGYNDIKPGDVIEVYELETVARKLVPAEGARAGAAAR